MIPILIGFFVKYNSILILCSSVCRRLDFFIFFGGGANTRKKLPKIKINNSLTSSMVCCFIHWAIYIWAISITFRFISPLYGTFAINLRISPISKTKTFCWCDSKWYFLCKVGHHSEYLLIETVSFLLNLIKLIKKNTGVPSATQIIKKNIRFVEIFICRCLKNPSWSWHFTNLFRIF